jgi:UDP-N-acetylglucosamine--N-acetylmuramyl-(pentapeptide) pyrophosphoryl-undecaprenol N-acetylglucosamine transferase
MINRVIISGGGTGGHIFPAIAIANELIKRNPTTAILFIGAIGKMEMDKVPLAGYSIEGLNIVGFRRSFSLANLLLPFKLLASLWKARQLIKSFQPELVIGVGGYASGPTLKVAGWQNIPTIIQEQNSFPGKTNLLLAKKAALICTAYSNMDAFFPQEKIALTGNPVRSETVDLFNKREEGLKFYGLDSKKKTILVIGGSLGARTLNDAVCNSLSELKNRSDIQLLWQCGQLYFQALTNDLSLPVNVKMLQFIERMDLAYAAADIIVSRAGAISISELCIVGKPTILIPSPNVSEDHQTKNAMVLVKSSAALIVKDNEAKSLLFKKIFETLKKEELLKDLSEKITLLGKPNAVVQIVDACQNVLANLKVKHVE